MPDLEDWKQKALEASRRIEELRERCSGRDFDAAEEEDWQKANADFNEARREMEREQKAAEARSWLDSRADDPAPYKRDFDPNGGRPAPEPANRLGAEQRALALQAFLGSRKYWTDQHRRALEMTGLDPNETELPGCRFAADAEFRSLQAIYRATHPSKLDDRLESVGEKRFALSVGTPSAGGYTVPEGFVRELEIAMLAYGTMMQVSDVRRTAGGENMPWPNVNDTGNKGRRIAEGGQSNTNVDPTFGRIVLGAETYTSEAILISMELLEDSAFDMARELGRMLGERLGRAFDYDFTLGSGTDEPNGIITAAPTFPALANTAISPNDVIDLQHDVDPSYRRGASYMMHDKVVAIVRKLRDDSGGAGTGQWLWVNGLAQGVPDTLAGYPLRVNQNMATAPASDAKTMAFGDLTKYKIRMVRTIRLYRLVEAYRVSANQDAFVAFARGDGDLQDAGTGPVKVLQHPT